MNINELNTLYDNKPLDEVLAFVFETFNDQIVLASSLGLEDQLLTHHCLSVYAKARIFVLDTGRLHQETYDVMAKTQAKYDMRYEVYYPNTSAVETLLRKKGPNSFYDSIDNRKE